ncbi:DUF1120 domain-containing protein [Serratia sp. T13T92]|jgi:hypothetical protein|uniref:DUF1120 domain-containing protein n=1 Tax=Serratia TaxID=613 RepID=UPI000EF520C8|nr:MULTISPECIES: DUF1120 domain-containing protein [Serratia]AYM91163.1 DUF1120 domain-containing protein [Serratia sp. 3ACOL1]MBL5862275.1 DUF1120 domain-containing protein [Serratia fonticola]MBL5903710.1 DUF1120 domain-containing protein [Serratia fonticola]MDK2374321.1 DUF1120 domain-containing protein [Serratia fonticola]
MKLFKLTTLPLILATSAVSLPVMAAETAQIMVKGSIVPTACSISVAGSADFGNLTENELKEKSKFLNAYQLGYKPVNFDIQCNSAAKVALSTQADIPPSGPSTVGVVSYVNETEKTSRTKTEHLGNLGVIEGHDIGYFTTALVSANLDDKNSELIFSQDNGHDWQAVSGADEHVMYQDGSAFYSWGKDNAPQEATNISGVINISAAIDARFIDDMKEVLNFNSSTTLSLQYL